MNALFRFVRLTLRRFACSGDVGVHHLPIAPHEGRRYIARYARRYTISRVGVGFVVAGLGLASVPLRAQVPPVPEKVAATGRGVPKLVAEQRLLDVGKIVEGEKLPLEWVLENRGDGDLQILRTQASCGCTLVKLEEAQKTVKPGSTLRLSALFDSTSRTGEYEKTVTVYSNDPLEPELRLSFHALVSALYEVEPVGILNLQSIRRGEKATKTAEFKVAAGRKSLKILSIENSSEDAIEIEHESVENGGAIGERVRVTISDAAAVGMVRATAVVKLSVDEIEREYSLSIRGQIVGDLTWRPLLLDTTRQPSLPGRRLAPLTIESTDKHPFEILRVDAGPLFETAVETPAGGAPGMRRNVLLTVRDDAPPGPFAASLKVFTDCLDQPLIEIPVFGAVTAPLEVDPPVVYLRQDGTPAGTRRRLKLQAASSTTSLKVYDVACDQPAVQVTFDDEASARYQHLRYYDVTLSGPLPKGSHQATLTFTTNIERSNEMKLPVTIQVP